MGGVVRCSAVGEAETSAPAPGGATGGTFIRTYGTPPSDSEPAPAPAADAGAPASSPPAESTNKAYECSPGAPDCPTDHASGDVAPSPTPDECSYTPELPYCAPAAAPAPAPADGPWKCAKDMATGEKVCESPPACAPGTHAAKCGACVEDGGPVDDDCIPPSEGGCWVTGGGFIVPDGDHANFGGNAKQMKRGGVQGHWNHVDHTTMNHLNGKPNYIFCRHVDEPGPGQPGGRKGFIMNQIYFGGPAKWGQGGGVDGFWFDVVAKDHGEPGSQPSPKNGGMVDTYHLTVRKMDDPVNQVAGQIVYEEKGGLVGGNIQMHPPNNGHPGVQSPLPKWVSLEP